MYAKIRNEVVQGDRQWVEKYMYEIGINGSKYGVQ